MLIKPGSSFSSTVKRIISSPVPLKILVVAPEISPYANVGGLSRVVAHLSRALMALGADVRLFMPKFGFIDEEKYETEIVHEWLEVPTGGSDSEVPFLICNVKKHIPPTGTGATVYFLENMEYYEKRANVYGYSDDPLRWALFSRGILEFLRVSDWVPDVIHVNDWQTGYLPNYLRTVYEKDKKLLPIATVFTIHNLSYQGMFDHRSVSEMDFDDGRSEIASFFNERLKKQNFMKRGIICSDIVSTVSETYAYEIMTPEFGEGLDKLIVELRNKIFGVLNGIDYDEYNPATDHLLVENYDANNSEDKVRNKLALQKEFGLKQDKDIPVISVVGRLEPQKGYDLAAEILWPLLRNFDVQFIAIGGGDLSIVEAFRALKNDFPEKVGIHLMPNFSLPHLVFAGSDIMLFPARFEPCGLVQMEAMRYGTIPVARAVGGLADTIEDFNPRSDSGVGFVFKDFDKWQLFAQIVRALEVYSHQNMWKGLVRRAMAKDFSWKTSAKSYLDLYGKAIHFRKQLLISEGQIAVSEGDQ